MVTKGKLSDRLRHEARILLHIAWRDMPKRVAAATLMCALMYVCHRPTEAIVIGLAVLASELGFVALHLHRQRLPPRQEFSIALVSANWAANTLSTIAFCAPTLVLATMDSIPMLLTSLFWIFGVLVHITNTYVDLPIYNRSQVVPCYITVLMAIWTASGHDYAHGMNVEWWMLAGFAAIYASNTFQTMEMQRDTQRALEAARAEAQARLKALERMARFDSLTRQRNRQAFDEDFKNILAETRNEGIPALIVIDLDGFKPINDSYGHDAGDRVLREVARRLQVLVQGRGITARIGGDEFALGMRGLRSRKAALELGLEIVSELERPITGEGPELRIGASVGIVMAEPGMVDVARLTQRADQAMYRAKADNGSGVAIWDPSLAPRLDLEDKRRLRQAFEKGEILPYYQPKVALDTGRIVGFEALARWVQPNGAVLSPMSFLPQITELGLQTELLQGMVRRILTDMPRLSAAGLENGRIAINLPESALATRSGRAALLGLLDTLPGALDRITFEITEDVIISRSGNMLQESIKEFRARGALISLDDFGTGYASFQHLRQLDFDELKIDKSFVAGLCEDDAAAVLIEGFLSIARGLGVSVVAEGVETVEQERRLVGLGCTYGQGFRYGKALPLPETEVRLVAQSALGAAAHGGGSLDGLDETTPPGAAQPRAAPDG